MAYSESDRKRQKKYIHSAKGKLTRNKWRLLNPGKVKEYSQRNESRPERKLFHKSWDKRNPEKRKEISLRSRLKLDFGISLDEFNKMLDSQKGLCKICGKPETAINPHTGMQKMLSVDHNHSNGKIRGLLCGACNTGLGLFEDNPRLLIAASEYLLTETTGN